MSATQWQDRSDEARLVRLIGVLFFVAAGIWLVVTLHWVRMEFDDGYTTIANARHFAGLPAEYAWNRAPLLPLLLAPVAYLSELLGVLPLDTRPYHLVMVVLHGLLLIWCWLWLTRRFGQTWPVLIAFLAAVPTVLFFSYAPFVSHDLIGGFFVLALLDRSERFRQAPTRKDWWILVALGGAAALVKQTYAIFWVVALAGHLVLAALEGRLHATRRALAMLTLAAVTSGVLTWLVYAWALAAPMADTPFLLRPWQQAIGVPAHFSQEGELRELIYQWVYTRNLWAYGLLAMSLCLPGLFFAWRSGQSFLRLLALAWIGLVVLMMVIPFKEVRYLAFLAPLNAVFAYLGIVAISSFRPLYGKALILILLFDLMLAFNEARRVAHPYYRNTVSDFLAEAEGLAQSDGRLVMANHLSFVSPESTAFFGDRFHRITHVVLWHLDQMLGLSPERMRFTMDPRAISADLFRPGDVLTFSNMVVVRNMPIPVDNATTLGPDFLQYLAVADTIEFRRDGGDYVPWDVNGTAITAPLVVVRAMNGMGVPLLFNSRIPAAQLAPLLGWQASGPEAGTALALRLKSICTLAGCQRVAPHAVRP